MKYINIKRYKFSTIAKNFNTIVVSFFKIFKFIDIKRYNFRRIFKYVNFERFNFIKITNYLKLKSYNVISIKKINFTSSRFLILHLPLSIIFFLFLYISIPILYSYDKSKITNAICINNVIKCSIKGDINYNFFPTPRLKIKDVIIKSVLEKNILITVEEAIVKLSFKNLLTKEKHKIKKIELNNFETTLDVKNLTKYKFLFDKKINLIPVYFRTGTIIFSDKKKYVASIKNVNINTKFKKNSILTKLEGNFLNEIININFDIKDIDTKISNEIILKMPDLNFLIKSTFFDSEKNNGSKNGNFLIKKDKHKISGLFNYKNSKFTINKSNIRNAFIDGKLEGKIIFLPYFDFNLDLALNSINFTKLYNYFLSLHEDEQKDLFRINNKINGKINLSADKVYSKHNLVKSFESRVKFYNGNVKIEQLLISLGKLGATDILGTLHNDEKNSNLKFESNIFVDNQKKFLSKFGIYGRESLSSNIFVSGNFDLENIRTSFYEISDDKKFKIDEINYVESEFNDLMLEDGFLNLFNFPKFKVFLKSIVSEKN